MRNGVRPYSGMHTSREDWDRIIAEWKEKYPPGTKVRVTHPDGMMYTALTAGYPRRVGLSIRIGIKGRRGSVNLSSVEVV
jgi:hypothetical protein